LVKEAIHHVEDPAAVVAGLATLLAPGGRLLVVMLPTTIAYPLFTAALELFERMQPDPEVIAALMRDSRLEAEVAYEEFELSFEKQRYLKMVQARYMSLLSHFTDTELAAGIAEIDGQYAGDRLDFPDRLAFVLGVRG
jgi:2-polyprenyl-3-methyl-5-hydroxy-6-metoxy-1,4-benzoquinol methylase